MKIADQERYEQDKEKFVKLMRERLKEKRSPFAVDAIECLLKDNNAKSAFMVWLSFKGKLGIKLSKEEESIEQNWYYWFGK